MKVYRLYIALDGVNYTLFYPDLSQTKFSKENGDNGNDMFAVYYKIDKFVFSNSLSVPYGGQKDFDLLLASSFETSELNFKLYENETLIHTGIIQNTRDGYDVYNKYATLKASPPTNDLVNIIKNSLQTEFNWINGSQDREANVAFQSYTFYLFFVNLFDGSAPTTEDIPTGFSSLGLLNDVKDSNPNAWYGIIYSSSKTYKHADVSSFNGNIRLYCGLGQIVRLDQTPEKYYYSLAVSNTNNNPITSPAYWQDISSLNIYLLASQYSEYNFGTDYVKGKLLTAGYEFTSGRTLTYGSYYSDFYPLIHDGAAQFQKTGTVNDSTSIQILRGSLFSEVFKNVITSIDSNILFDQSNNSENGWCYELTNNYNFENLLIFSISQVKYYDGDILATFQKATLGAMFDAMLAMFNVQWGINKDNYFQFYKVGSQVVSQVDADLTKITYTDLTAEKMNISLRSGSNDVKKEQFTTISTTDVEFTTQSIDYISGSDTIEYNAGIFCNDVRELLAGANSEIANAGFCLIAVDGDNDIIKILGKQRGGLVTNAPLSNTYLIETFQKTGRPKLKGYINNTLQALTQGEIYKTEAITIPYEFGAIDMSKLYKIAITNYLGIVGARPSNVSKVLSDGLEEISIEFIY